MDDDVLAVINRIAEEDVMYEDGIAHADEGETDRAKRHHGNGGGVIDDKEGETETDRAKRHGKVNVWEWLEVCKATTVDPSCYNFWQRSSKPSKLNPASLICCGRSFLLVVFVIISLCTAFRQVDWRRRHSYLFLLKI
jgi:hypothetical protein